MTNSNKFVRILIPVYQLFPLDYLYDLPEQVAIGDLVNVPFRSKTYVGIVWEIIENSEHSKLKKVQSKLEYSLPEYLISLIKWTSSYYISSLGSVSKLVLSVEPKNIHRIKPHSKMQNDLGRLEDLQPKYNLKKLSLEQKKAVQNILLSKKPTLVYGVTGSGKTEVYFHVIASILSNSKNIEQAQVLIMLPEIALSSQIISRFEESFCIKPTIWNSSLTTKQKLESFENIISGNANVIIGARSSLFLPYKNLKCIIVDEEHDASYKQDDNVIYNARDVAVMIGSILQIPVILLSATPSLESYLNAVTGKYSLVELKSRYENVLMPEVKVINMRSSKKNDTILSEELIAAIKSTVSKGEQVLLYLNRRGYAYLILCKSCGYRTTCKFCSVWMVWHKTKKRLECHYCGYVEAKKQVCPECHSEESLIEYGVGIEKLHEEVIKTFRGIPTITVSSDNMTTHKKIEEVIDKIKNKELQIIIGTQVMIKGHHFPALNLVGIVDADIDCISGDIRSNERNFQAIGQVSGRSGRESAGQVYIQTANPDSTVIEMMKSHDFYNFAKLELEFRNKNNLPPFSKMVAIIISSNDEKKLIKFVSNLAYIAPKHSNLKMLGPASALIYKLNNKYRQRILLTAPRNFNFPQYIEAWFGKIRKPSHIHIKIDVDPYNFH